jgi:hypothetical protein
MVDHDFIGGDIVDMIPEPVKSDYGRSLRGDTAFWGSSEHFSIEDCPQETEILFIIGAGEDFDKMRSFRFGLANFVSEAGACTFAGNGEGSITSEGEGFRINHSGIKSIRFI